VFPRVSLTVTFCPDWPARTATAMKFPAVLLAGKASVEDVVVPASFPVCWTSVIAARASRRASADTIESRMTRAFEGTLLKRRIQTA
jgi:hypothetical protein